MSIEERLQKLLVATPEQIAAVDAALSGQPKSEAVSLRLLRMGQAAKESGISRCTLWRMYKEGRLRAVEVRPGSFRIPETELRKLAGV